MKRLIWRQHRGQLLWTVLVVLTFMALMVGVAQSADHWLAQYHHWRAQLGANHCPEPTTKTGPVTAPQSAVCQLLRSRYQDGPQPAFTSRYNFAILVFEDGLPLLAVLIGSLVGTSLVAREIEQRTQLVAWTQSISRQRWYIAKVVTIGACLAATGLVVGFANDRLQAPLTAGGLTSSRWPWFFSIDLAPAAEMALAFALAVSIGAWLRRTTAAVGGALITFLVLFLITAWSVRSLTPYSRATGLHASARKAAWDIGSGKYHPAGQYWPLQSAFVAILLLLMGASLLAGWHATRARSI